MIGMEPPFFGWLVVFVQCLGMFSAFIARANPFRSAQELCHGIFFLALFLVGMASVVSLGLGGNHWLFSGATLAAMSVAATVELN